MSESVNERVELYLHLRGTRSHRDSVQNTLRTSMPRRTKTRNRMDRSISCRIDWNDGNQVGGLDMRVAGAA